MSMPSDVAAETVDTDSLTECLTNIKLTDQEEDELLWQGDVDREEGMIIETEQEPGKLVPEHTMVLDAQLVYHRGRGSLIKEFACRMLDGSPISAVNMIHNADDVPAHLRVPAEDGSGHYDVHTGLKLEDGEGPYDDGSVADALSRARVVFVKGANKKRALNKIYERLSASHDAPFFQKPVIVNVDGHTADDEDRQFCKNRDIKMATFSFPFVYSNMHLYEKLLYPCFTCPSDVLYVSNVLSKDPRYNLSGKGRIVCVCYNDHSRGGTVSSFDKHQRCSLLNISILDHLWLRQQDVLFREMVRQDKKKKGAWKVSTVRRTEQGDSASHHTTHRRGRRGRRNRGGAGYERYIAKAAEGDGQRRCYYRDYGHYGCRAEDDGRYGLYDGSDGISYEYYHEMGHPYEEERRGFGGRSTRDVYDTVGRRDYPPRYWNGGEYARLRAVDTDNDLYYDRSDYRAHIYGQYRRDGEEYLPFDAGTVNGKRHTTRFPDANQRGEGFTTAENRRYGVDTR